MTDDTCGICGHSKVSRTYVNRPQKTAKGVKTLVFLCLGCDFNGRPPWRKDETRGS